MWAFGWDTPFHLIYTVLAVLALTAMAVGLARGIFRAVTSDGFPWPDVILCLLTGGMWTFVWLVRQNRRYP